MAKRDTSRKRNTILDAASAVFREEGFEATSMDRIAERAGASKRTVYNHFPSKDALFEAVMARFLSEIATLKQIAYDPDRDLEEQLAQFAQSKLQIVENPAWMGLMMVGLGQLIRDPSLVQKNLGQASTGEEYLVAWLQAATDDGRLHVAEPTVAAEVFWGMLSGVFIWPHLFHGPMDVGHQQALLTELIAMFLARYRKPV